MSARTPPRRRYSRLQITLHWGVAALLGLQLLINADLRIAFRARLAGEGGLWPEALLAGLHLVVGTLILALMLLRFFVRLQAPEHAPPPGSVPPWLHLIAQIAHLTLYAVVIGMALAGLAAWLFASPLAGTLHEAGRFFLVLLILAHVAGALVEHHMLSNPVLDHITGQIPERD